MSDLEKGSSIRYLGDYVILGEIASGGMGVVYQARQVSLKRKVALKVLRAGQLASPKEVERFRREAEAAASLGHPNIVQIYEVGEHEGCWYFSMELIEGPSLAEEIQDGLKKFGAENTKEFERRIACLMAQVARAVHHAHQHGVLHRDLKPGNILLDEKGEPHLTDFGIAKLLDGNHGRTVTNAIMGTPVYMAPEQAAGRSREVTTAADIYSLGAILYECLSGEPLFKGDSVGDILEQVKNAEPKGLRELRPEIDADLETICMACLEKDPAKRYQTVKELVADLEHYLHDEPIEVRRPSTLERLQKAIKRNKLAFTAGASIAMALLLTAIFSSIMSVRATKAKREALGAQVLAEQREEEVRRNLYSAQMNLATREAETAGGPGQAAALLSDWRYSQPDLRGWEWYYLNGVCHSELMTIHGSVSGVTWSPDGRMLASICHNNSIKIFSATSGDELISFGEGTNAINSIAWRPDGTQLAAAKGGSDNTIRIYDVANGKEILTIRGHTNKVRLVVWSSDARRLASASDDGTIRVWNADSGKELYSFAASANCLGMSPDGSRLASASGSYNDTLRIWDMDSGRELTGTRLERLYAIAWSPDSSRLACAGSAGYAVFILDARTGQQVGRLNGHGGNIDSVAWSPDGKQLASASRDWTVRIWDVAGSRQIAVIRGHAGNVKSISWSPNGTRIASAGNDGTIKVWEIKNAIQAITTLRHDAPLIPALAWNQDGIRLAAGGSQGSIMVWNSAKPGNVQRIGGQNKWLLSIAWSPDGTRLASTDGSNLSVNDVASGKQIFRMESYAMAWSPDSQRLALTGRSGPVKIWEVDKRRELGVFRGHPGWVFAIDWEPGGTRVASGGADTLRVWDSTTGKEIFAIPHGHISLERLVWKSNGTQLASAGDDGLAAVWDTRTGKLLMKLRGHGGSVRSVTWSPDGTRIATASMDQSVKIWDAVTGKEVGTIMQAGQALSLGWGGPGGMSIASGLNNATVSIRDATLGYALERSPRALPGLDHKLAIDPQNARCLKLRAMIYAHQGNWEKAASDVQQYLALPENKDSGSYQTGWWVTGPYPEGLEESYAPELKPDPSQPVDGPPGPPGATVARLSWLPLSLDLDADSRVDFPAVFGNAEHLSVYALRGIYAQTQHKVVLVLNSGEPLRVWLNGQVIHEQTTFSNQAPTTVTVPVTLESGWNKLLVRASHRTGPISVSVRLAERSRSVSIPSISPQAGVFTNVVHVSMGCSTPGAEIRFTTDGTEPSQSSQLYKGVISITNGSVVTARAFADGLLASGSAKRIYTSVGEWRSITLPGSGPRDRHVALGTDGRNLYFTRGNMANAAFYSIPKDATYGWTTLAPLPLPSKINTDSGVGDFACFDGALWTLALADDAHPHRCVYRFNISKNTWTKGAPIRDEGPNAAIAPVATNRIFGSWIGWTRLKLITDWTGGISVDAGDVPSGASHAWDSTSGPDHVYVISHNETPTNPGHLVGIRKFGDSALSRIAGMPFNPGMGSSIEYLAPSLFTDQHARLYILRGGTGSNNGDGQDWVRPSTTNQLAIYDLVAQSWTTQTLPFPVDDGSEMCLVRDTLYVLAGNRDPEPLKMRKYVLQVQ